MVEICKKCLILSFLCYLVSCTYSVTLKPKKTPILYNPELVSASPLTSENYKQRLILLNTLAERNKPYRKYRQYWQWIDNNTVYLYSISNTNTGDIEYVYIDSDNGKISRSATKFLHHSYVRTEKLDAAEGEVKYKVDDTWDVIDGSASCKSKGSSSEHIYKIRTANGLRYRFFKEVELTRGVEMPDENYRCHLVADEKMCFISDLNQQGQLEEDDEFFDDTIDDITYIPTACPTKIGSIQGKYYSVRSRDLMSKYRHDNRTTSTTWLSDDGSKILNNKFIYDIEKQVTVDTPAVGSHTGWWYEYDLEKNYDLQIRYSVYSPSFDKVLIVYGKQAQFYTEVYGLDLYSQDDYYFEVVTLKKPILSRLGNAEYIKSLE